MYQARVWGSFNAAHNLRGYKGKCENLHGHNWKVEICVCAEELNKTGMVEDFTNLKDELKKILKKLDHSYINKIPYFTKANPTSENIAKFIYDSFNKALKDKRLQVDYVAVWETDTSCAVYKKDA